MARNIDFCRGNIERQLILFSLPIVLGELLQSLYNSVDALVVGNFVGKGALAAVSVCSSPSHLLIGFFNGMSVGASVIVSYAFGRNDQAELDRSMRVSFTFSACFGVLMAVLGIFCAPLLLRLAAVRPEIYHDALAYLRIYLAGLMFTVIYNIGAGILRAIGDSETPFRILLVSCGVNILMDVVCVKLLAMGVAGAAVATVFSQLCSVMLVYRRLRKQNEAFHLSLRELGKHRQIIWRVVHIGFPAGTQQAMIALSNIFIWRYINSFGTAAVAGIGVAQKLDNFVLMPCKAFGMTITTFVSQNVGARQYRRSREGILRCLMLAMSVTLLLGGLAYGFAGKFISLFNADSQVVSVGVAMVRTIVPFYLVMDIKEILAGVLSGHGYTQVPMFITVFGMIVVRQLFLAAVMPRFQSVRVIYFCYPTGWVVTMLLLAGYYLLMRRHFADNSSKA